MNFTRSQLHERITDLSGQYRAAQENKRLTSEKRAEQDRLTDLARQADEKADVQLAEVATAIRDATAQYAAAADEIVTGVATSFAPVDSEWAQDPDSEPPLPPGYNSIFTEGADFHSQALQNGLDRIGEALDASRT